jgi:phosphatidylserine/phosphatidylglycerophosphate/cardiolipin synthase-like enzyme
MIEDNSRRTNPADLNSSYQPYYPDPIPFYGNSTITPLIDGAAYFLDLYTELNQLYLNRASGLSEGSDQRIYIAGWVFNPAFTLANNQKLTELLRDHAADGVDVRVLLWVNEGALGFDDLPFVEIPFTSTQRTNITTAQELRSYPNLENQVILNVLDHLYGSSHMKMVLVADNSAAGNRVIAYTGGIDFSNGRKAQPRHGSGTWHDVQARIEGDVNVAIFEFFKALWDELVERRQREESRLVISNPHLPAAVAGFEGTTRILLPDLDFAYAVPEFAQTFAPGDAIVPNIPAETKNTVQSLRTVPDVSRSVWWPPVGHPLPAIGEEKFTNLSSDVFEIYLGFKCAIAAARSYIYIENSVMYSRDLWPQLKNAIVANSELKVILLTAAGTSHFSEAMPEHNYYLYEYLYKGLEVPDQPEITQQRRSRVVLYKCLEYYTHAKVMIVDDKFAIIGSANIANKSFFSDLEHSISFIDNDGYQTVKEFRQRLWEEHFRTTPDQAAEIAEIDAALHVWNEEWGVLWATFTIPTHLELTAIAEPAPDFGLTYRQCVEEIGALP